MERESWSHLKVGLLRVLRAEEGLSRLVPGQLLVDPVNGVGDVLEAGHEEVVSLLLDPLKVLLGSLGLLPDTLEVFIGFLQFLSGLVKFLHGFHVRSLGRTISVVLVGY